MLKDIQACRLGNAILVGIAVERAVLDVETTDSALDNCSRMLQTKQLSLSSCEFGKFGKWIVMMNLHHDRTVSIFVDGPEFSPSRTQSMGLYLSVEEAERIIEFALNQKSPKPH